MNAKEVSEVIIKDFGAMALKKITSVYGGKGNEKTYVNYVLGVKKMKVEGGYDVVDGIRIPDRYFNDTYAPIFTEALKAAKNYRAEAIKQAMATKQKEIEPLKEDLKAAEEVLAIYKKRPEVNEKKIKDTEKEIDSINAKIDKILNL